MNNTAIFLLPGLYNSGPQHWQTHWEAEYGFMRIEQKDWETPVCEDWINTIDVEIARQNLSNVILIGHSLACCTIVHWANKFHRKIKGALLVGPSDVDAPSYPPGTTGFKPMPLNNLPFPSIVIASSNDEYVSMERARHFAYCWGSELHNIGDYGHINSSSNLGLWPEGYMLLEKIAKGQ
jgi:uncharacterized protein